MTILIRSFNPSVTGKTGAPLHPANFRDCSGWVEFEQLLFNVLIDRKFLVIPENQNIADNYYKVRYSGKIVCHSNKSINPDADLFYMQMFYKNIFELDTLGWGVENSNLDKYNDGTNYVTDKTLEKLDLLVDLSESGRTKHPQTKHILPKSKRLPEDFIFVPLQTNGDYVIKKHSPISVVKFIESISRSAKYTKQNVVFKIHPYSRRDKEILMAVYKAWSINKYVYVSDENVTTLIKKSRRVVVINSGVGFESLVLGKSVTNVGNASYAPCCNTINTEIDVEDWLSQDNDQPKCTFSNWFSYYITHVAVLLDEKFDVENKERIRKLILEKL